jgi:tetratricopeptide (TPR) repeat protein
MPAKKEGLCMEITLTRQEETHVTVTCDGQPSHTFDLAILLIPHNEKDLPHPLDDPVTYGKAIYTALFPPATPAQRALQNAPERILLVTTDNNLDAIPWEYAYGPYGAEDPERFLVLTCHLVRGLPVDQRIAPPQLQQGPHIVAIPSNPLSHHLAPLNIEGEWIRLKEIIQELPYAITLERTRPPTLDRVGLLVANQQHRIVHFMGHGGQDEKEGAILCFEKDNGDLDPVTAQDFLPQVRGSAFLVTLNACVSATPGADTHFSNLAFALVRQKTPYALGMRFSIPDDDALTFSRTFYSYLARGTSIEEAVYRVRHALSRDRHPWAIGVPVLYTALSAPAPGYASISGTPTIKEHLPPLEVSVLPRAEGAFQGRIDALKLLGTALTGDHRQRIVTIHGGGGQGKTALAREAAERFAYAWPGGVWATTLETLPGREIFVTDLARFLGIATEPSKEPTVPADLERRVLARLAQQRTLIVLDNAETLVDAVEAHDASAIQLAQFIQQLSGPSLSLLVTSRVQLGWSGEVSCELGGLSEAEGAALFRQGAPQRAEAADMPLAQQLSQQVAGHPLSIRLLGGAFNASAISLQGFIEEWDEQLLQAENKYVGIEHRQRTLYASIETSIRHLNADLRALFSGLWLFHAPFLPETAVTIFDAQAEGTQDTEGQRSPIYDRLHTLWRRGLLTRETATLRDGTVACYRLLPTMRPYIEHNLSQAEDRETLLARFGAAYAQLVRWLYDELDRSSIAVYLALQSREDLERGISCVAGITQGYYVLHWGWILHRLGDRRRGLELTERALEIAQAHHQELELQALNYLAVVYQATGRPQDALKLYEQALPITREVGDRAGEAATLSNLAVVYQGIGRLQEALRLYEQALPITREVGDRAGEATTLNGLAYLYQSLQRYTEAQRAFEQSILLSQRITYPAAEVAGLVGLALLLYQYLNQPLEAITTMDQALAVLRATGLPQDAAGNTTESLQRILQTMRTGVPLEGQAGGSSTMPEAEIQQIVNNTIAVMMTVQDQRAEWREDVTHMLQDAEQRGADWQIEVDFFTAILAILDGRSPGFSPDHPYSQAIAAVQDGIAAGGAQDDNASLDDVGEVMQAIHNFINASNWEATRQVVETQQALLFRPEVESLFEANIAHARSSGNERIAEMLELHLSILRACKANGIAATFEQLAAAQEPALPFDADLIARSIAALSGGPQEKMEHMQYLATLTAQTTDEGLKALINTVQLALFGSDLSQLGQDLHGVYRQAWDAIVEGVKTKGEMPS